MHVAAIKIILVLSSSAVVSSIPNPVSIEGKKVEATIKYKVPAPYVSRMKTTLRKIAAPWPSMSSTI